MIKIRSENWKIPSTSVTFRELVLNAEDLENGIKLFTTVERGAGNNKIHLITTASRKKEAANWADEFTNKMDMISSVGCFFFTRRCSN